MLYFHKPNGEFFGRVEQAGGDFLQEVKGLGAHATVEPVQMSK